MPIRVPYKVCKNRKWFINGYRVRLEDKDKGIFNMHAERFRSSNQPPEGTPSIMTGTMPQRNEIIPPSEGYRLGVKYVIDQVSII